MTSSSLWLHPPKESWHLTWLHYIQNQEFNWSTTCIVLLVMVCWMCLFSPLVNVIYSLIVSDSMTIILMECSLLIIFYMILIIRFIMLLKHTKHYPGLNLHVKYSVRQTIGQCICQKCSCIPRGSGELKTMIFIMILYCCLASFTVIMIPFTNELTTSIYWDHNTINSNEYLKKLRDKFGELGWYIEYMCENINPDYSAILSNMNDAQQELFELLTKYAINLQIFKERTKRLPPIYSRGHKKFVTFKQFGNNIISRKTEILSQHDESHPYLDPRLETSISGLAENEKFLCHYIRFVEESLFVDIVATICMIIIQYCICIFSEWKFVILGNNYKNENYWVGMILMAFILHLVLIVVTQFVPQWKNAQMNKYLILNLDPRTRHWGIINLSHWKGKSISYTDIIRSYLIQTFCCNRKLSSYIEFELYCHNISHFVDMINNCCITVCGKGNIGYVSKDVCVIIIQYMPKMNEKEFLLLLKNSNKLRY